MSGPASGSGVMTSIEREEHDLRAGDGEEVVLADLPDQAGAVERDPLVDDAVKVEAEHRASRKDLPVGGCPSKSPVLVPNRSNSATIVSSLATWNRTFSWRWSGKVARWLWW